MKNIIVLLNKRIGNLQNQFEVIRYVTGKEGKPKMWVAKRENYTNFKLGPGAGVAVSDAMSAIDLASTMFHRS